jgi:hypothetical protein
VEDRKVNKGKEVSDIELTDELLDKLASVGKTAVRLYKKNKRNKRTASATQ